MDNKYVAVKTGLDLIIDTLRSSKVVPLGKEGKVRFDRDMYLLFKRFQSTFMQEALFFDKIYMFVPEKFNETSGLIRYLAEGSGDIFSFITPSAVLEGWDDVPIDTLQPDELEPLLELQLIGDTAQEMAHKEILKDYYSKFPRREDVLMGEEERKEATKIWLEFRYPIYEYFVRAQAWKLEHIERKIATPLLPYTSYRRKLPNSRKHDIAQFVIHDMPIPDSSSTEWERIIEYRENPDNRKDLVGLRRWIRKISTEDISPAECAEELEWLQSEFQAHMRLHKMKANTGTLEVMVKTPLEVLENLLTLKFSKFVDPLFAIKKRQIDLMEAELNAPGREIAYLIKAKQSFGK
jgi:hypothetical protein